MSVTSSSFPGVPSRTRGYYGPRAGELVLKLAFASFRIKTPGGFRKDAVRGALEGCSKKHDRGHSVLRAVPCLGIKANSGAGRLPDE